MINKGAIPTKAGDISCYRSEGFYKTFASYF